MVDAQPEQPAWLAEVELQELIDDLEAGYPPVMPDRAKQKKLAETAVPWVAATIVSQAHTLIDAVTDLAAFTRTGNSRSPTRRSGR